MWRVKVLITKMLGTRYFARLDTHAARAIDELRAHVAQASEMLLADVAETLETGSLQILETAVSEFYHPHFNPSDPVRQTRRK